ncbi:MAG TPA: hypothetical protein VKI44_42580 [Acetobacteraceae bacterium]|nr:hypothetical protein [Acetobacteraceae bacterium]
MGNAVVHLQEDEAAHLVEMVEPVEEVNAAGYPEIAEALIELAHLLNSRPKRRARSTLSDDSMVEASTTKCNLQRT